ncbi:hypothetical protein MAHJHV64_33060 [Mycobacterium avium subsp. hominissuis]
MGLSARSTTDWSITSVPREPTSAKRATGPVTATPKTTSIPVLLHPGDPATSMSRQHYTCDTVGSISHSAVKLRLLAQRNQLFEGPDGRRGITSAALPVARHCQGTRTENMFASEQCTGFGRVLSDRTPETAPTAVVLEFRGAW